MRIHLSAAIVAVFSMLCAQAPVWGQGRTMLGGGSTTGGSLSSRGRTFGGGTNMGTRDTTSGAMSQLEQSMGRLSTLGTLVQTAQQRGAFVGTSSSEMQGFAGSMQAGQNTTNQQSRLGVSSSAPSRPGGSNRSGASGRGTSGRGTSRGRRTTTQFRSTIRIGFSRAAVTPTRVGTELSRRLSSSRRIQSVSPVEVVVQGRTATLRGVVATNYDRALSEQLARLEPGIAQVKNELVVAVAPAEPELSAPDGSAVEASVAPPVAP